MKEVNKIETSLSETPERSHRIIEAKDSNPTNTKKSLANEIEKLVPETINEEEDEDQTSEENQKYIKILKRYFGYSSFRK